MRCSAAARRGRGFTLIELLITVAIVGLLASVAIPLGELAVQRTKEMELRRALQDLRGAIDEYKRASDDGRIPHSADQSGYPPTLMVLVEGVKDAKSAKGGKIYFLRRVPRDPFAPDAEAPPERSWGLRSYESPPDNPRPGADVFDVYSLSEASGVNGVPYRNW